MSNTPATAIEDVQTTEDAQAPALNSAQIQQYLQMLRKIHGAKCRTKGFTKHVHQPAGNKLARKLERHGSLYGRLSLVGEMFKDIQARKFKEAKELAEAKLAKLKADVQAIRAHETNTTNPIDFPARA